MARLSDPDFYKSDPADQARIHSRIAELGGKLEVIYARWDELEALRADS